MDDPAMRPVPGFSTRCIHGLATDHPRGNRPVATPIHQTSTFAFASADQGAAAFAGESDAYIYTRLANPTQAVLEERLAAVEGGEAALALASGMAAATIAALTACRAGDNIVAGDTLYGGTHELFMHTLPRMGITVREVDTTDPANVAAAMDDRTRLIFFETPANPTLRLTDIAAVAEVAHAGGALVVVDNTFCTPYLQNPLALGADVVLHSATKYISGHGDTIAGVLVGQREFIDRARGEVLRDVGACISPFNAWLLIRGLKTLPVRMERHCANAARIAAWLQEHPKVTHVDYPGLPDHPQHALARRQQRGFGGMISFLVRGGRGAGRTVMDSVRLCTLAVSLGDVDTLIEHPASMTHSTYDEQELAAAGIDPGLVRLSVGLEDPEDIIADLEQALARI